MLVSKLFNETIESAYAPFASDSRMVLFTKEKNHLTKYPTELSGQMNEQRNTVQPIDSVDLGAKASFLLKHQLELC